MMRSLNTHSFFTYAEQGASLAPHIPLPNPPGDKERMVRSTEMFVLYLRNIGAKDEIMNLSSIALAAAEQDSIDSRLPYNNYSTSWMSELPVRQHRQ